MNWVIGGTIAYVAALAFICRLFRHATGPEPCYVDPELAQQVKEALAAGPQSATLARIAAHTHAHATGHPVHVVVVTRETITRGDT